jgi:DNA-binding GntR family transcriptional regulator
MATIELRYATSRSVRAGTLHDEIVAALRALILEGALAPGERIIETDLCTRLNVSRTPLREALKVLAAERLVELRPNRSSVVAEIRPDDIAAMFEILPSLEALVGELVCARISNIELEELEAMHERLAAFYRKKDRSGYFRQNQQIHLQLAELTRNPALYETYSAFAAKVERARYTANYDKLRWEESMNEHEAIMRALRARNGELLSRRLREHNIRTGTIVIDQLRKLQEAAARPVRLRGQHA